MGRRIAAVLITSVLTVGMGGVWVTMVEAMDGPAYNKCAEDDACWDCRTMGNQVCGTTDTIVRGK